EELDAIRTGFATDGVVGVVVAGAVGVGKTRLARAALDALAAQGCRTEWMSATRTVASIPFAAVKGLLPPRWSPHDDPLAVLRTVAAHVHTWGGRRHVAIGVDDAHLLDNCSAALIAHLAAEGTAFVLLTAGTGEPAPDAVVGLWKDGAARRLDLAA